MRHLPFILLLALASGAYGQSNPDYFVVAGKDTLTIALTEKELVESKQPRVAELRHTTKHRKKKLQERSDCELKLYNNDTTFWAEMVDFYDNYFIALTGTLRQDAKNKFTILPLRFRRIAFSEIEWIKTDGKRNITPQLLLSTVVFSIGSVLTILSIKDDFKGEPDPFPPALIPVGLGITYLGVRLFDGTLTKKYSMHEWNIEVKPGK